VGCEWEWEWEWETGLRMLSRKLLLGGGGESEER
jgi:hypothetical protein